MNEQVAKVTLPGALLGLCLFALYLALYRPSFLYQTDLLGAVIFLQLVVLALWKFRERFFPFLVVVFLWAGADLPLAGAWNMGRWAVLAIGAAAGLVLYIRDHTHHFGILHLLALFAVIAATVSALVSAHPEVAILKAGSLFLLFLYASTGGRLAVISRELKFFSALLLGCEVLVYAAAITHFIFRYALFGNPNSLGAIMGVAAVPLLTWGYLVSQPLMLRRRRGFALVLAIGVLLSTYSRASIVAAAVSCAMLCIGLRRYRVLVAGMTAAVLCGALALAITPPTSSNSASNDAILAFLYKGNEEAGAFGSRRSVWDQTFASIRQHPWFGTGFGTSATDYDTAPAGMFASSTLTAREHGNSYLAISEWVGLAGVVPFSVLLLLIVSNIVRVARWMRKTRDPFISAVPMAVVLTAGLVHAAFEDWLFAVGYYLCIFFWILAFAMVDVLPALKAASAPAVLSPRDGWRDGLLPAASAR